MFIGLKDSYNHLASPTNVRQNHWTFTPSGNACVSIQSFALSKYASASSLGFPANSGLKCDQVNCGICCIGCLGTSWFGATGSCTGCWGACGAWRAGTGGGTGSVGGPASAMFIYVLYSC